MILCACGKQWASPWPADHPAGTFHSNLPKIIQTLRYALLHKDKRTFADASDMKADWCVHCEPNAPSFLLNHTNSWRLLSRSSRQCDKYEVVSTC